MGRVGGAADAPVAPSVAHGRVWLGAGSMSCLHGGAAFAARPSMLTLGQAMGKQWAMGRVTASELLAVGATDVVLTAPPVGAAEEAIQ